MHHHLRCIIILDFANLKATEEEALLCCSELFSIFYNPGCLPLYTCFFDGVILVGATFAFSLGLEWSCLSVVVLLPDLESSSQLCHPDAF